MRPRVLLFTAAALCAITTITIAAMSVWVPGRESLRAGVLHTTLFTLVFLWAGLRTTRLDAACHGCGTPPRADVGFCPGCGVDVPRQNPRGAGSAAD